MTQKRKDLSLADDHPALVIFDRFKGQCTERLLSLLDDNNLRIAIVPANCTDRLQPLDVSVNKPIKEYLRNKFQEWYSNPVRRQIDQGKPTVKVDLRSHVSSRASWGTVVDQLK